MNNDLKAFSTDELFHLTQTIITTVKLLRPEATTNDIMDTAVVAISAMAADICRNQEDPCKTAEQIGKALTGNIVIMMQRAK